jgi:exonuclease III
MIVFTWNLNRNEQALRLALDYLNHCALRDSVLATLQELPPIPGKGSAQKWSRSALLEPQNLAQGELELLGPVGPGRVGILVSSKLVLDGTMRSSSGRRFLYVPLRHGQLEFAAIAIHAISRADPRCRTDFQRGSHAALTRRTIDKVWDRGRPLVLFGDFNAGFREEEVRAREGFYLRSQNEIQCEKPKNRRYYGRNSPPLENLMRRNGAGSPYETYRYADSGEWHAFDQIAVSDELGSKIKDCPQVHKSLNGKSLLTKNGNPDKRNYSDHLPVEVTIQL